MAQNNWFYETNGQQTGPVTVKQLRQLAANGQLQPNDRVRKEDMDRWVRARAVRGLFAAPTSSAEPIPEQTEGDTVFDFFGSLSAPDAADEARAAELRAEFDFFSSGPQAPARRRKSKPPRKSTTEPPAPKGASAASDAPIQMSAPVSEEQAPADVPMAEVVEDNVSFALAEEVPMASALSSEFGTRPDLSGSEVILKSDGAAEVSGAMLAISLHNGWLTAQATLPGGAVQESYLKVDRIDAIKYRARPGAGEPNGKAKVLSFHTGWQCVALMCEDQDSAVRAFVQLVMAGV